MDLFTLSATLGLNREAYTKGLQEAQGETENFVSKGLDSLGNFASLGAAKLADMATTGVKDLVEASVETGKNFDSAMSQVAATMGKTMDEMSESVGTVKLEWGEFSGNLRDYAREMGANTMFSATQAAEALNFMALAGYNTQQSMEMLPNVLNLAAAGGMELQLASDMVTDAQTALNLSFEETNTLVDQMAVTSQKSNTSVSQLGEAILRMGANARDLKGGTTELNTVLGVLADNGIKGAEAGTHFRNIIKSLGTPTDQARKELKKLGVQIYDDEGNLRNTIELFADLNNALSGMTSAQRNEALSEIFNTTDMAAINALLGTSEKRWVELTTEIQASQGAASKMAQIMQDNLGGSLTTFNSAFEDLQISISERLLPHLKDFVDVGTVEVGKIKAAFEKDGLGGAIEQVTASAGTMYDSVVQKFKNSDNKGLQRIGAVLERIRVAFTLVTEAVTVAIENITELANAFGEEGITGVFTKAQEQLGKFWKSTKERFKSSDSAGLRTLGNAMQALEDIAGNVQVAWENIKTFFAETWETLKNGANTAIDYINEKFGLNIPHIEDIKWPTWEEIKVGAVNAWESIKNGVKTVFKFAFGENEDGGIRWPTWDEVKQTVINIWETIKNGLKTVFKFALGENEDGGIKWPTWEDIKEKVKGVWETIKSGLKTIFKFAFGENEDGGIKWPTWEEMKTKVADWWATITGKLKEALQWTIGLFTAPDEDQQAVIAVITGWWDTVKGGIIAAIKWTLPLFGLPEETAEKIGSLVTTWWDQRRASAEKALVWFMSLPKMPDAYTAGQQLHDIIAEWWTSLDEFITAALQTILPVFGTPADQEQIDLVELWWTKILPTLSTICNFTLGLFGLPSTKEMADKIENWWEEVKASVKLTSFSLGNSIANLFGLGTTFEGGTSEGTGEGVRNFPSNKGFAKGLNYVPYDDFTANLHRGEAVLNADDARDWRNSNSNMDLSGLADVIASAINSSMSGMSIEVDKQILGRVATVPVSRGIAAEVRARRYA